MLPAKERGDCLTSEAFGNESDFHADGLPSTWPKEEESGIVQTSFRIEKFKRRNKITV